MSEFGVQEEFQHFLEEQWKINPGFVMDEFHYFTEHCRQQGVYATTLNPLFINDKLTQRFQRFGLLVTHGLERILASILDPHSPHCSTMREILHIDRDPYHQELVQAQHGEFPRVIRPDTVIIPDGDGTSMFSHEFNVSWPGGTEDTDIMVDELQRNALYQRFSDYLRQQGIELAQYPENLNTGLLLEQLVEASGKERPYIVIAEPDPFTLGFESRHVLSVKIRDVFREQGHAVNIAQPWQIEYDGHKAALDGMPIDVIYRIFEERHIKDDPGDKGYRRIVQAEIDGKVALVNSSRSDLIGSKAIFEIIWDDRFTECFDEGLLMELREYIPLTKNLARLSEQELDHILNARDQYVIKGVRGSSGSSVFLGHQTPERTWATLITENSQSGNVVVQQNTPIPQMPISFIRENKLESEPRNADHGPLYYCGSRLTMGTIFGRYSRNLVTSAIGDGGGMYAVVSYKCVK